jgi:cholest-4-en-3-one 26-monooxygenase
MSVSDHNRETSLMTAAQITVLENETYGNGNPLTFGLPLDQYDWLREHEPVHRASFSNPLLLDWAWVLSRYEDVETVDRNPDIWAFDLATVNVWKVAPIAPKTMVQEIGFGKPAMLMMDGEDHRRNRGTVSRAFTPARVKTLEQCFREYARQTIDAALTIDGPFNFVDVIAHQMPLQALGDVLGVPEHDRAQFFAWVDKFASPFDERVTPSFELVAQSILALLDYAIDLKQLRTREPGEDVMSMIVQAGAEDQLDEDEIAGNVALLASGAAESTRSALSHAMHQLMLEPEKMAWLRERADDIPSTAVQEILRVSSPFIHFVRTARHDTELHGQPIAAGEKVAALFASANFDPEVFENPGEFNLERDPNPHFSFGKGPHKCLGQHVAALEIKLLLEELLQRTKAVRGAGEISYVKDVFSRGVYGLPVTMVAA